MIAAVAGDERHAQPPVAARGDAHQLRPAILFAGGGSGGHISPGLAIAERLLERAPQAKVHFACSSRPIDAEMLREAEAPFTALPALPISLRPSMLLRSLLALRRSRRLAEALIASEAITHVVALGGFVAPPVALAARRLGVPVTLLNLDARPGRANRWLAARCDRVLSAVPVTVDARFARTRPEVVGLPLRRMALAPAEAPECRRRLGIDPALRTLLVTGASQGALSINRLLEHAVRETPRRFEGWQIVHLAGAGEIEPLLAAYRDAGVRALVLPFLGRIGLAWGSADAAISRAGANSVAEAVANAVPTLFLPYPYHRDLHQRLNAEPVIALGGGLLADDRVDPRENLAALGPALDRLLRDHDARSAMRDALRRHPPPDAAEAVAELLAVRSPRPRRSADQR